MTSPLLEDGPRSGWGAQRRPLAACLLAALAWLPAAHGQTVVNLHYQDRPPYSVVAPDGSVRGSLAEPAARAFTRAGIAFAWVRTPGQRQLALIQSGDGPDCGIGWFRNAEREALGRFTRAIYQDQPFMGLARRDAPAFGNRPVAVLLGDAAQPLLVKDGYSYGPALDALIALNPSHVRRTAADSTQMVRMIDAARAGWMIVAPEEAGALLAVLPGATERLRLMPLPDVPAGPTRHVYCNRSLPDAMIERLDRAIGER
jgi:polar amino acid transport system substrate-binding protein